VGHSARRSAGTESVQAVTKPVDVRHALFETPIGQIAVAWSERGLVALQLPDATARATERRLVSTTGSHAAAAAPDWVRDAARRIAAHLDGAADDLGDLPLDLEGAPPFHARVYLALRTVGPGETVSYGELARRVGSPGAARAVGQAMRRNPLPIVVPCHRVLASTGAGGFSAPGGLATKRALLRAEGVTLDRVARR
jgi:methylated-DNA-[protein]-cysteine S-methyltransferase